MSQIIRIPVAIAQEDEMGPWLTNIRARLVAIDPLWGSSASRVEVCVVPEAHMGTGGSYGRSPAVAH